MPPKSVRRYCAALISAFAWIVPYGQCANLPTNANVVHGNVTFNTTNTELTVTQTTNQAIVNWETFSISDGHSVFIDQPASAAMLARVTGAELSTIGGTLRATGSFFLSNPNGITTLDGSTVAAKHLLLSTYDIDNASFLAGALNLAGDSNASLDINGTITAQFLTLLANDIMVSGTLNTESTHVGVDATPLVLTDDAAGGTIRIEFAPTPATVHVSDVATNGSLTIHSEIVDAANVNSASGITINATGNVTISGTLGGNDITLISATDTINTAGDININSTGDVLILGELSGNDAMTISSSQTLTIESVLGGTPLGGGTIGIGTASTWW